MKPKRFAISQARSALLLAMLGACGPHAFAQSAHWESLLHESAPPTEDIEEAARREKAGRPATAAEIKRAAPHVVPDFVSFGYIQNNDVRFHLRWESLTHLGIPFTVFNSNGAFTNLTSSWNNRPAEYGAGGAAQAAGTKIVMVINSFDDGAGGAIEQVFQTPAKRATLIANVGNALKNDPQNYNAGVSVDIEFSWNTTTRNGISAFFQEMRAAFNADPALQGKEITVYTHPTYSANLWDIAAIAPHIDYMILSGYDWGTSNTPRATTDQDAMLGQARNYLNAGLPPEKLVIAYSTYGRTWTGTTNYGAAGSLVGTGRGFTDGLYDTTLNTTLTPPIPTENFNASDVVSWYTFNDGLSNLVTIDSPRSMHEKIRTALSFPDTSGAYSGRRIRGVAFWSLFWTAELSSRDPRTGGGTTITRTRVYPHVYQAIADALHAPGQAALTIDGFERADPRWRDPDFSPDTSGSNTTGTAAPVAVAAPAGAGRAASTTNAMLNTIVFNGAGTKRAMVAHEVLSSPVLGTVRDTNAYVGVVAKGTLLSAKIYAGTAPVGATVRLVVVDANRQMELGPATALVPGSWRDVTFDLTDDSQATGFATAEPGFVAGNGVVNSNLWNVRNQGRDIGVFGFLVESLNTGTVTLHVDELTRASKARTAANGYRINEFTYPGNAGEFVEIHGPAGAIPAGVSLQFFGDSGNLAKTVVLDGQVIPASGLLVVGDPGVANVALTTGFSAAANDIPDTQPAAIILLDTVTDTTIDAVTYKAFGGLRGLTRPEARGASDEGYPWLGEIAGTHYAMGRYPDGADSNVNAWDFFAMKSTPGVANGTSVPIPSTFDFSTMPAAAYLTFPFASAGSVASGVGASPSGGNVLRIADVSGGQMAFVGDTSLGANLSTGYKVSGYVYIPATTRRGQAIGIGFCGRQGSNFFANAPAASGYESGYWLLFQNNATVALPATGLVNHAQTFKFVHATHDNQDGAPVQELGSLTAAAASITPDSWVPFEFSIDPSGNQLTARINGADVYTGAIPAGGPLTGAIQFGHRETDTGNNTAADGTWIDQLVIAPNGSPAFWMLY